MIMKKMHLPVAAILIWAMGTCVANGQDYPSKPIRIIAGTAGGGTDLEARLIAQEISGPLGQPVLVENRAGVLPFELVAKSPPDGHVLLVASSPFYVDPQLRKSAYDPVSDFSPITMVSAPFNVLVVHPAVPAKNVRELIDLAKAKPGALNYGSSGMGTSPHLAAELFKALAGVNVVHVPYSGGGPSVIGLLGGQVQLAFATATSTASHIKSGKLRALAITSARPSALLPDLPTMAASGLQDYEFVGLDAAYAPARTPAAIVNRLSREMLRALNLTEVKAKLAVAGAEAVVSTPMELEQTLKAEIAKISRLVKSAGIRVD